MRRVGVRGKLGGNCDYGEMGNRGPVLHTHTHMEGCMQEHAYTVAGDFILSNVEK